MTPLEIQLKHLLEELHGWSHTRLVGAQLFVPSRKLPLPRICIMEAKRSKQTLGWYSPVRWQYGAAKLHEIVVAPTVVGQGPYQTAEVIVHELAHLANWCLEITDVTRQGRYHNLAFKTMAEQLGLTVKKHPTHGWRATQLGEELKALVEQLLQTQTIRSHAFQFKRQAFHPEKRSLVKLICRCEHFVYATSGQLKTLAISCQHCKTNFNPQREIT